MEEYVRTTTSDFTYDPFASDVMDDPHPFYRILRDEYPMYRLERYDAWAVSRFDDVLEVLADPTEAFVTTEGTIVGGRELERHNDGAPRRHELDPLETMNNLQMPEYGQIRQAMGAPFRPRAASSLEDFVTRQVHEVLTEVLSKKRFDLTQDFGGHVASRTVCHLLGLNLELAPTILRTVNAATRQDLEHGGFNADTPRLFGELMDIARVAVETRRAAGADGTSAIVDGLINFRLHGRPLTDDEIVTQLRSVIVGGTETVPKVVAHGLYELMRHPQQLREVKADIAVNVPTAFNEMLRFCAPAQWFLRTVDKPVVVAGVRLSPGTRVFPLIMSANRDEREFDHPDEFIWDRPIPRSLAFGFGRKFCLGSHVARLEGHIMVREFLTQVRRFDVDEDASSRPPSNFQWGWSNLVVEVES